MKLDHCVYFSDKSPAENVKEQREAGYPAVAGGSHKNWGTQNVLLYCKNAYIEWLSVEHRETAEKSTHPLTQLLIHDLKDGAAWGSLCFSVEGMETFRNRLQEQGFKPSKIYPAQRQTPQGEILKWKMLFVEKDGIKELPYPFFIEWEEPEAKRIKRLKENGSLTPENEKIVITECILAAEDPQKECDAWRRLLGAEQTEAQTLKLSDITLSFRAPKSGEKARLKEVVFK